MHIKERDISLFLDNALEPEKRDKLNEHFSVCKICKAKLEEWQSLYSSLNSIEYDNELAGLERKVMYKIKTARSVQRRRQIITIPSVVCFLLVVFMLSLFAEPLFNVISIGYKEYMGFMLDGGLEIMNEFKWKAIDIIEMLETMKFTGIFACMILIVNGIYFTVKSRKIAHKV